MRKNINENKSEDKNKKESKDKQLARKEIYGKTSKNVNAKKDKKDMKQNVKNKNMRIFFICIGIAVIIIIISILAAISAYSDNYVAYVGKEKISVAEFKFFLEQEKANMLSIAGNPDPETFWDTTITGGEKAIEIAKRKTLENLREFKIQLIRAKEQKITLDKSELEQVDSIINSVIAQYGSKSAANKAYEENYGINLDEFRQIYKDYLLRNKLLKKEIEGIEATEDEIEDYYNKFPEAFTDSSGRMNAQEAVWVKYIFIATTDKETQEKLSEDKLEEAKKKAEDLLTRAKNGEDFGKLAAEYSEDSTTAAHGGDFIFGRGYMWPELEELAFGLEPGGIDMVEVDNGYYIVKLEEKIAAGEPVSLRCAKEYWEFGINGVKIAKYLEKMEEWKMDPKYKIVKNEDVYNSIR